MLIFPTPTAPPSGPDVLADETELECFVFDHPLFLGSELHVAGALAFAAGYGFAGLSLVEWTRTRGGLSPSPGVGRIPNLNVVRRMLLDGEQLLREASSADSPDKSRR